MSYSTNTTIISNIPLLPQSIGATGYHTIKDRISRHIIRADNLINSMISNRYDVSGFDTSGSVPPLLQTFSEDISTYYEYRSEFSGDNQNDNEWLDRYKDSMDFLKDIRDGNMDLVDSTGSLIAEREIAALDLVESNNESYQPLFDEDGPLEWKVDDDKLDTIEDNR